MNVPDVCTDMVERGGILRLVGYLYDPESPKDIFGVRLLFEGGDWLVTVVSEDDTVAAAPTTDADLAGWSIGDVSTYFPWAAAVGKRPIWVWSMENNRGYLDAIQWEFGDTVNGGSLTVQVLAIASRLDINSVLTVETPYLPSIREGRARRPAAE